MSILELNIYWMGFNLYLALLPLLFYWGFYKVTNSFFRVLFLLLWFLYLPNTLYVITDIQHLFEQWDFVARTELPLLLFQYIVLIGVGLWTHLVAFYPVEYALLKHAKYKLRNSDYLVLIVLHFVIGFGMVLGKVARVNSWEVFSNPERVYLSILQVLQTPELVILTLLFGSFGNLFYFLFRKPVVAHIRWFARKNHQ